MVASTSVTPTAAQVVRALICALPVLPYDPGEQRDPLHAVTPARRQWDRAASEQPSRVAQPKMDLGEERTRCISSGA